MIRGTKTPLGFFTLTILFVEAVLAYLAARAEGEDFTLLLVSMIVLAFCLVGIVAFMAIKHPEVLGAGRLGGRFGMQVRLVLKTPLPNPETGRVYVQKLPKPLSQNNPLVVNQDADNEPYIILPGVRVSDRLKFWLCHNGSWYASENVSAAYRRLMFFPREGPEGLKIPVEGPAEASLTLSKEPSPE